ncbi:MAG: DUF192 domain-containing protein [Candidatus Eremiobacteraeota bacterium]|nr:DUF192 domain-containing protein [Candidatus Eremiobacteraeota bacterium]
MFSLVLTTMLGVAPLTDCPASSRLPVAVIAAPKALLRLEVARTDPQRECGLMYRTSLAEHTGMLFVFAQDAAVQFWMKNTLVPLDMIFVAADGTVRTVFARVATVPRALADDQIPREGEVAKYVIELPAGEAARDGIVSGTKLNLENVQSADSL